MWAGALRETLQDPPSEVRLSPGRRCVPLEQELGLGSGQLPKQWVKPCTAEISALGQPGKPFPAGRAWVTGPPRPCSILLETCTGAGRVGAALQSRAVGTKHAARALCAALLYQVLWGT